MSKWKAVNRQDGNISFRVCGDSIEKAALNVLDLLGFGLSKSEDDDDDSETVECSLCLEQCNASTAHLHNGGWVGDECCWDDRLKASE